MHALVTLMLLLGRHPGMVPQISYHMEVVHTMQGPTISVVADTLWVRR